MLLAEYSHSCCSCSTALDGGDVYSNVVAIAAVVVFLVVAVCFAAYLHNKQCQSPRGKAIMGTKWQR
jgi:signal transduction histidine kinase